MNTKNVVCFDLWDTLIQATNSRDASYEEVLVELGVPQKEIYPFVRDYLMTKGYTYEEMVDSLFNHFDITGRTERRQEAALCWEKDNKQAEWCEGALDLLQSIRSNNNILVLITNSTKPAWKTVDKKLKISSMFARVFLSWEQGVAKPNPRVWQKIESWFSGIIKPTFWMIGDNERDDLSIPKERGWQTALVKATDL